MIHRQLFTVLCLLSIPPFLAADDSIDRPNIILMMADDMGLGDTSAYQDFTGNSDHDQVSTPNMERLARMGVRFTDAHTPSSRCSPTRYALLTGRYPWRNRLKYWVLFGSQGDPMIERDRPTIATMLKTRGYQTAMVGKWHVGLRYRRADGSPAAGFLDADLSKPMFDTPLDHGFDFCWFTSRSHGTSGPQPGTRKNNPKQNTGPGHIDGRIIVGSTNEGRKLVDDGEHAYVLENLGKRHSDNAIHFLDEHLIAAETKSSPFFLYYPSNSNHTPHTPSHDIDGVPVQGASKNVAGDPMDRRSDYIYENDVALGRLIDYLEEHNDPRNPGRKLIETTMVLFTSDNGAEKNHPTATGPFRSNKGSCYEGGHRVPFIVAYPGIGIGDGNAMTPGKTSQSLIGLLDMYATFATLSGAKMPDLLKGEKGAEDSVSVLAAMQGESLPDIPKFFHDHKEAKDAAASAMRLDSPTIDGKTYPGHWKIFFDAGLLRYGIAKPTELYELVSDSQEANNRVGEAALHPLIEHMGQVAALHRNSGGHRWAGLVSDERVQLSFQIQNPGRGAEPREQNQSALANLLHDQSASGFAQDFETPSEDLLQLVIQGMVNGDPVSKDRLFRVNDRGLGISGGEFDQVESGEQIVISFNRDVVIESAGIVAGNGVCGGMYRLGKHAPSEVYCIDADIDAKDQSGLLSDIGLLKAGEKFILDSTPIYPSESAGRWRLQSMTVRLLKN